MKVVYIFFQCGEPKGRGAAEAGGTVAPPWIFKKDLASPGEIMIPHLFTIPCRIKK